MNCPPPKSHPATNTLLVCALALAVLSGRVRDADACCPAFPADAPVAIADQEILIVWDEEHKTEHFVRQAGFESRGTSKDFGFLVPTPTKPTLAEAQVGVFDALRQATKPVPEEHYEPDFLPLLLAPCVRTFAAKSAGPEEAVAAASAVRVLDRQTVAGYDAAVLEADDAEALTRWLRDNGYDARPEIAEWAKPYIASRWKITAFKYDSATEAGVPVATGAVRLSFETDRPLFPYRVPTDQLAKPGAGHMLRVFFASTTRFDGALGAAAEKWSSVVRYASNVEGLAGMLAAAAPAESLAKATWLTVFEDSTWPSGRDDLFFTRASAAERVIPTYRVPKTIPIPLDVVAVLGYVAYRLARRARRNAT